MKRGWGPLAVIASAHLMAVLDTTVMFVALPSVQQGLGLTVTARQWVVTAYTLALAGLLLLGGRLADWYGARNTLLAGVIGVACASAAGGAATGYLAAHATAGPTAAAVHGFAVAMAWGAGLLVLTAIPVAVFTTAAAPARRPAA